MIRASLHTISRRSFSLALSVLLLLFEFMSIPKQTEYVEEVVVPVIEPVIKQDCHILTRQELSQLYSYKDDINTDSTISLTINEATLLMQIARAEGGDTLEGQLWVMGLIINRLYDEDFPDTISEIISAPKQFEVFTTGAYKTADVNTNSHLALAQIESGENPTMGCLYFESSSNSHKSWHSTNREFVAEIAGNRFYK